MIFKILMTIMMMFPSYYFEFKKDDSSFVYVNQEIIDTFKEFPEIKREIIIDSYKGPMTAYGPDCIGCIGITASGYNVKNGNIYYYDKDYGNLRILAADKSLKFGSVIRISGLKEFNEPVVAIVLDRGSAIGFNKRSYFDLLYKNERETNTFGCQYVDFEVLRIGY